MEILTTAEVEGKVLSLEQTFNYGTEGRFVTIKELFSIEEEIFVSLINNSIPYTLPTTQIQTNRFFMPAKQFVAMYNNLLS
jgi:hypothetical protein